jgi:prepilin-type N-terminal cleavage/methylation domain-containing protein
MKKQQTHHQTRHLSKGFTLVELMVSLGIFMVVIMAAIGSLYSVNNASRKVEAMRNVLDNLNFAIESMSRTIRTGTDIVCEGSLNGTSTNNCTFESAFASPGERISVMSTLGNVGLVEYRWAINPTTNTGVIEKYVAGDWVSITAPSIDIQHLSFYVDGADDSTTGADDFSQPNVIMLIQGVATAEGDSAPFSVQTLVTSRTFE